MAHFANRGRLGTAHIINIYFLTGVSPLEGMLSLHSQILLLNVPQALTPVKDGLVSAYSLEIALSREHTHGEGGAEYGHRIRPEVTKDNVEALIAYAEQFRRGSPEYGFNKSKVGGLWGQVQLFRGQIYTRWADILQEQGIDATKEGFTDLVVTP